MRSPLKTVLVGLALVTSTTALGQDQPSQGAADAGDSGYDGVSPGSSNVPPRAPDPGGSGPLLMTWPGFQQRPDGASRFFLQTTGPVQVEQKNEDGRFVLLLKNTRLHLRNNRRPLETRYFNTPVSSARIERRGRDLAFVLDLRGQATPMVSTQQGTRGFNFILLEFPAGNYLPEELRTERDQPASPRSQQPSEGTSDDDSVEIMVY